jgi:hypothetical protein
MRRIRRGDNELAAVIGTTSNYPILRQEPCLACLLVRDEDGEVSAIAWPILWQNH